MENLKSTKTDTTPEISLNFQTHQLEFSGDSRPENAKLFYTPVFNWITDYFNYLYFLKDQSTSDAKIIITVNFKFEYFNSSSAKYIIEIIKGLNKINTDNPKAQVNFNWFYEDEDLLDTGKEFVKITGVPLTYHSI